VGVNSDGNFQNNHDMQEEPSFSNIIAEDEDQGTKQYQHQEVGKMVEQRDFDGNRGSGSDSDSADNNPSRNDNGSEELRLSKRYLQCSKGLLATAPSRQQQQEAEEDETQRGHISVNRSRDSKDNNNDNNYRPPLKCTCSLWFPQQH
jgi:hypothetical protein